MTVSPARLIKQATVFLGFALLTGGAGAQSFGGVVTVEQRSAQPDYGAVGLDINLEANAALVSEGMWEGLTRRRAATLTLMAGEQTGIAAPPPVYLQPLAVTAGPPRRHAAQEAEVPRHQRPAARLGSPLARRPCAMIPLAVNVASEFS